MTEKPAIESSKDLVKSPEVELHTAIWGKWSDRDMDTVKTFVAKNMVPSDSNQEDINQVLATFRIVPTRLEISGPNSYERSLAVNTTLSGCMLQSVGESDVLINNGTFNIPIEDGLDVVGMWCGNNAKKKNNGEMMQTTEKQMNNLLHIGANKLSKIHELYGIFSIPDLPLDESQG